LNLKYHYFHSRSTSFAFISSFDTPSDKNMPMKDLWRWPCCIENHRRTTSTLMSQVPSYATFYVNPTDIKLRCTSWNHCRLYPPTSSGVEHCKVGMRGNLACLEPNQKHDGVCRDMAVFEHVSSICSDYKTIFAALNSSFSRCGRGGCIR